MMYINRVKYKGYEVAQAPNYHVHIMEDGRTVMHVQCDKPMTDDELKELVDFALEIGCIKAEMKKQAKEG